MAARKPTIAFLGSLAAGLLGCRAAEVATPAPIDWLPGGGVVATAAQPGQGGEVSLPLNLEAVLKLAGDRPLDIALAKTKAAEAFAEQGLANSQWLPTLRPRIAMVRHEGRLQDTVGNLLDVDKQNAFGGGGLGLQFNPAQAYYDSVVAARQSHAATLGIQAAQHVNVEAAVHLYYDLLEVIAGLQIAEQTQRQATELVKIQEAARAAGRGLDRDVLHAKAFLAGAKGRVARSAASVSQANARLAGLLVLSGSSQLIPTEQAVVPIDFGEWQLDEQALLKRATAQRPDLEQARVLMVAAEQHKAREAWSWLLPEFVLGADYGTYGATLGRGRGREDYYADLRWSVGFGTPARARAADARYRRAEVQLQARLVQLRTDVRVSVAEVRAAHSEILAAREEVAAASSALELVKLRHREDLALFIEVIASDRAWTQARIGLVGSICAHNRAQFTLHRLLGGGGRSGPR